MSSAPDAAAPPQPVGPEDADGIRWSWASFPATRIEAARMIVPLGAMYTPLKQTAFLNVLPYEPVRCKQCTSILNPFCPVDFRSKFWSCPFCMTRNAFPSHYADISETNLPAELYAQFTTIEYTLARPAPPPPVFVFVVDLCVPEVELRSVKDCILKSINILPSTCHVGLITFGTCVNIFELGFGECCKSYVFRGNKDYTTQQLHELLGLRPASAAPAPGAAAPVAGAAAGGRFILPISDCLFNLEGIIEDIAVDPWPIKPGSRPLRCTGSAVSIAVGLLESAYKNVPARVMLFTGGPCTVGPGQIVDVDLASNLRSHSDVEKGKAAANPVKAASKFYAGIGQRAATNGHVVDVFACYLDQIGVYEMRQAVHMTGGFFFLSDEFNTDKFRNTFDKVLEQSPDGSLNMAFDAVLEVQTSREWKVSGLIGSCLPLPKKTTSVGETDVGYGGTALWRINAITNSTTVALFFEVANAHVEQMPQGSVGYAQFLTTYQHSSGQARLRVTTVYKPWVTDPNAPDLALGFDQEAAAVLMARVAVFRANNEDKVDIIRWLDRSLIRLVQRFGEFRKDDPNSFRLAPQFAIYPQFMFHLRRCFLLQTSNSTPDETAYYREVFMRQAVTSSLMIIQPTLQSFSFEAFGVPVLLDATSIGPDRILILDSFFEVVVFLGETIAKWKNAGYHEQEAYANFKQLLETPRQIAATLAASRFPSPLFVECQQHDSKSRLVMSRVNPSVTHQSGGYGQGDVVFTEDVSLQVFMDHLKRLSVASS